jgi:hypothetical protein
VASAAGACRRPRHLLCVALVPYWIVQSSPATANPAMAKTLLTANAAATPDCLPHKPTPPQRIFTTAIANAKGLSDSLYAGALWSAPMGLHGAQPPRVGHVHAGSHQLLHKHHTPYHPFGPIELILVNNTCLICGCWHKVQSSHPMLNVVTSPATANQQLPNFTIRDV